MPFGKIPATLEPINDNQFPKPVPVPDQQIAERTNRRPAREPNPLGRDTFHCQMDRPVIWATFIFRQESGSKSRDRKT